MLEYLKNESDKTLTENGAAAYSSTGSECLNFFASAGAIRKNEDKDLVTRFMRAFSENPDLAMKILFFARDVRGGLGERRVFRTIIRWLAQNEKKSLEKNIGYIAEYGRWDDLLSLIGTDCQKSALDVIKAQLKKDIIAYEYNEEVSLLAKWLPSVNASNPETVRNAKIIIKYLGMKDSEYRRTLSALRERIRIIENNLREKDYTFDYEKQPSKAMLKYRKAFYRNDGERYSQFLSKVHTGEAKLHADTVAPYELVEPYIHPNWYGVANFMNEITDEEKATINATWESLPDYGTSENALAVIDTSGSMYCSLNPSPASVALSLGIYFAEHSKGAFANHFIEFSERPQLIEIKGETFADKLRYICSFCKIANTNLDAVFDLILRAAVNNNVPQSEMPSKLYIISDMEFDCCIGNASVSNFEMAKKKFSDAGYELPQVVFWNVASRHGHNPVKTNDSGVALVSGCTPKLFEMVAGGSLSPYNVMMEITGSDRYKKIAA